MRCHGMEYGQRKTEIGFTSPGQDGSQEPRHEAPAEPRGLAQPTESQAKAKIEGGTWRAEEGRPKAGRPQLRPGFGRRFHLGACLLKEGLCGGLKAAEHPNICLHNFMPWVSITVWSQGLPVSLCWESFCPALSSQAVATAVNYCYLEQPATTCSQSACSSKKNRTL